MTPRRVRRGRHPSVTQLPRRDRHLGLLTFLLSLAAATALFRAWPELIALGALGARRMRQRWRLAGVAIGSVVGIGSMAQGSQFASDVVFSLLLFWGGALALRAFWLWATLQRRRMHRLLADFGSLWAGTPRRSA